MYLFFNLIFGIVFITAGFYFGINPPRFKAGSFGYKTRRSTTNEDTWEEANRYAADMMIFAGLSATAIGIFLYIYERNPAGLIMSTAFSFVSAVLFLSLTEFHLMTTFDENGKRKLSSRDSG